MRGIIAWLVVLTLLSSVAQGETWTVVSEAAFLPYNDMKDGEKTGIDTETVGAVQKEIGITPSPRPQTTR